MLPIKKFCCLQYDTCTNMLDKKFTENEAFGQKKSTTFSNSFGYQVTTTLPSERYMLKYSLGYQIKLFSFEAFSTQVRSAHRQHKKVARGYKPLIVAQHLMHPWTLET